MPKIGGRWTGIPDEVVDILSQESLACGWTYVLMLRRCYVERIPDTPGLWIAGRIAVSRYEISKRVSKSRGHFGTDIWPRWEEMGVVEMRDGGVYLPMLFKKGEEAFEPSAMLEKIDTLQSQQAASNIEILELRKTLTKFVQLLSEGRNVITAETIPEGSDYDPPEAGYGLSGIASSLLIDLTISLSQRDANKMVSRFYGEIGQKRISRGLRDRAIASIKKLMKEGYRPGQIAYALEWIPKNATEEVKHFGIVPHMIDQAIEAGEKELAILEARQAVQEQREVDERSRLSDQQESAALENYKDQLPDQEREDLREKVVTKLQNTPGIKDEMISEIVINAFENELIRETGVDLSEFMPPPDDEEEE